MALEGFGKISSVFYSVLMTTPKTPNCKNLKLLLAKPFATAEMSITTTPCTLVLNRAPHTQNAHTRQDDMQSENKSNFRFALHHAM